MVRNGNIDALRIIAAIGIISLHVGDYPELSPTGADIIRSSFRWGVPFFFMVTGYYVAELPSAFPKVTLDRLALPFRLFLIANVIFFPVLLAQEGISGISLGVFVRGAYGHLWYLTALIVGLLTLHSLSAARIKPLAWMAAGVITVAYIATNYYYAATGNRYELVMVFRELSGIPAILIGGLIRASNRNVARSGILMFAVGGALLVAEMIVIRSAGWRPSDLQFFASTLPLSAGILGMAISSRDIAPSWLSQLGNNEGTGVYLYHPAGIILGASAISGNIKVYTQGLPGLLLWGMAAAITLGGLAMLSQFFPRLHGILNGRFVSSPASRVSIASHGPA
jgi:surface polysaccharide O-acyltransferase-like enzyme